MIQTTNLTRKYGDLVALDNLNLNIEEGECYGFIGPNGAGKTTTIKILATLLKLGLKRNLTKVAEAFEVHDLSMGNKSKVIEVIYTRVTTSE